MMTETAPALEVPTRVTPTEYVWVVEVLAHGVRSASGLSEMWETVRPFYRVEAKAAMVVYAYQRNGWKAQYNRVEVVG